MPVPNELNYVLRGHHGPINTVRFNKNGKYCMTCGHDRTIRLWNPHRSGVERAEEALLIKTYSGPHGKEVRDVCITQDNNRFASCGGDKSAFVWDVASGKVIKKYQGHDHRVNAVKFNKDDTVLVSAGYDKKICTWDLRSHAWTPIQTMSHCKDSITSLQVTDALIIAGSVDGCVRMYDLRNGMLFCDNLHEPVTCVSLSNDGNCLLASCLDSTIRLIEKDSGGLLNQYRGHKNEAYPLSSCLSSCDAYVLSGSEDGKVYAWDLVEGTVVQRLDGHTKTVSSVAYHPKDALMVSVSHDGTGRVWQASAT